MDIEDGFLTDLDKLLNIEWFDTEKDFGYDDLESLTFGTPYYLPETTLELETEDGYPPQRSKLQKGVLNEMTKQATEKIIFFLDSADTREFLYRSDASKPTDGYERQTKEKALGLWTVLSRSHGIRNILKNSSTQYVIGVDGKELLYDVLIREVQQMLLFINGRAFMIPLKADPQSKKNVENLVLDQIYPIKKPCIRLEKGFYNLRIYDIFRKIIFGISTTDKKEDSVSEETMLIVWLYCFMVTKNGIIGRKEEHSFIFPDLVAADLKRDYQHTVASYRQTILYGLLYGIKRNMLSTFRKDFPPDFKSNDSKEEKRNNEDADSRRSKEGKEKKSSQKKLKLDGSYEFETDNPSLQAIPTFDDNEDTRREWLSRSTLCHTMLNKVCMEMIKYKIGISLLYQDKLSILQNSLSFNLRDEDYRAHGGIYSVFSSPIYLLTESDRSFWDFTSADAVLLDAMNSNFSYPLEPNSEDEERIDAASEMYSNFIERYRDSIKAAVKNDIQEQEEGRAVSKYSTRASLRKHTSIDYARVVSVDLWDKNMVLADDTNNSVSYAPKEVSFLFRGVLQTYYSHFKKRIEEVNFPFLLSLVVLNAEFFEWIDLEDPEFEWMSKSENIDRFDDEILNDDAVHKLEFNCVFFDVWTRLTKPTENVSQCPMPFGNSGGQDMNAVRMHQKEFEKTFGKTSLDYVFLRSMWRKNAIYEPKPPEIQNRRRFTKSTPAINKPLIRDRVLTLYDVMERLLDDVNASFKDLYELDGGFGSGLKDIYKLDGGFKSGQQDDNGRVFLSKNYVKAYNASFRNHSKNFLSVLRDEYVKEGNYLAVWFIEEILYAARWCYAARNPHDFKYRGSFRKPESYELLRSVYNDSDVGDERNGINVGWFKDEFTKLLVVRNEDYVQSKVNAAKGTK
jgi:hypothetical protein